MRGKIKRRIRTIISVLLAVLMLGGTIVPLEFLEDVYAQETSDELGTKTIEVRTGPNGEVIETIITEEGVEPASVFGMGETLSDSDTNGEKTAEETVESTNGEEMAEESDNTNNAEMTEELEDDEEMDLLPLYQDGRILIYSYEQLLLIGQTKTLSDNTVSSNTVTNLDSDPADIGTGKPVVDENGEALIYSLDGSYAFVNDIPLPEGTIWQLPEGFAGNIAPLSETEDRLLYDEENDIIYIYHPKQLAAIISVDPMDKTVLSEDVTAETFSMGEPIFQNGKGGDPLTYDSSHQYVLSAQFDSAMPPAIFRAMAAEDDPLGGRDFIGQVVKVIDGERYILIGNEQQLQAIGTNVPVNTAAYDEGILGLGGAITADDMIYGGDADLLQSQNGKDEYTFGDFSAGILDPICGVNQETGAIDEHMEAELDDKYATDAKYIIFRDIDLSGVDWKPMTLSGTMIGAKAPAGQSLWNEDSTALNPNAEPAIISNINVTQTNPLDVGEHMGVGFFGTINSRTDEVDFGLSAGLTSVSNLVLENVTIQNNAESATYNPTLIGSLLGTLGSLLGGLLDGVLGLLGGDTELQNMLTSVLTAQQNNPTALATGAFAGRVIGEVEISNCTVTGIVSVQNANTAANINTGGFVGYTAGMTEYDGLSDALGSVVDLLAALLNVVPGLGLGDLITVLLGDDNLISLGELIPIGYISPKFINCTLDGLTGSAGSPAANYAGGFVGQQVGVIMDNCIIQNSDYDVNANKYGGGFAGLTRNGDVEGTLTDGLSVDIGYFGQPQSLLLNCQIINSSVDVTGTGSYIGGFTGALANSYAINCTMNTGNTVTVTGGGDCVGGFTGVATVGWAANLGKDEQGAAGLLGTVTGLLVQLLSEGGNATALLSLVGIDVSAVMGCQIQNTDLSVTATGDYAGGLIGKAEGVYITMSSPEYLNELSFWGDETDALSPPELRGCSLSALRSVSVDNYAGGVVGAIGTASIGGLLNGTLGLGSFLGFTVNDVDVTGVDVGYTVEARENCAGGGFGEAVGGSIFDVQLAKLKNVTAYNTAGGFIGISGPGELAGTGGLTVNLLGLNYLLDVSNLLSIGQAVEVSIENCKVSSAGIGYTVAATGTTGSLTSYTAAGFVAQSSSTRITNSHAEDLLTVTADADNTAANNNIGYAGGFIAVSKTGGLAEIGNADEIKSLLDVDGLLTAIDYLIPQYNNCTVTYKSDAQTGVQGDIAGGFAADFQSGKVDNSGREEGDYYSVYNIDYVNGQLYAGGFGGRVYSGALADAGKGISILGGLDLSIDISSLVSVINTYVPYVQYAGVKSDGFTVSAAKVTENVTEGSAGGFAGYVSGAQISYSDVNQLKSTVVTPPDDLESVDAPTYFGLGSEYTITGGRYAGGYVGDMDIGSAASVGSGLKVLGSNIVLTDILEALSVVVTTVEHSDVIGGAGGFSVLASASIDSGPVGMAGGFAGAVYGGHIQDSNANNFSYVIGQNATGGYVGELVPGDLAKVLDNADVGLDILGTLVDVDSTLASLLQDFVPTIRNSSTSGIPCGGAVRAQASSDPTFQRGMAGGYVGHNMGGQIFGLNTDEWKEEHDEESDAYSGPKSICKAERIASVYGYEYAGGYTGLMECADTAHVGGLSVLSGLIDINNVLGALSIVYPTQTNTAVYGPLANLDLTTWNTWVDYVGRYGGYGASLAMAGKAVDDNELKDKLQKYVYGYNVVAGRNTYNDILVNMGGDAGGYVGLMNSGALTNCMAYDTKLVAAMHSAGGFAGQMSTGGVVDLGSVSLLGLDLNIGQLLNVAQFFVPSIKNSSVQGFQSGLTVRSGGAVSNGCGYAGGYVGSAYGGQIQIKDLIKEDGFDLPVGWSGSTQYPVPVSYCNVTNLRRVTGNNAIGGYVGLASAASTASVNTDVSGGIVQMLLDSLISSPGDLVSVLNATLTTIRRANISPADNEWGFAVEGASSFFAGGFAGSLEAAVIGDSDGTNEIEVEGLRNVIGGLYAGGFFGLADLNSVAQISGTDPEGGTTSILSNLIKLGDTDVLDVFRTYIYYASVMGVQEGMYIQANSSNSEGILGETRYAGCAGGFGGGMMNGHIENCTASRVATVEGLNYTGGFVGHLGKSGVADIDDVGVLGTLLGGTVGALDLFGAHVEGCTVNGYSMGAVVHAAGGEEPIAGGFVGYADLARIDGCDVNMLKKVVSEQIAGGFVGKTDMNYIVSLALQSYLLEAVLSAVDELIQLLYLPEAERAGLVTLDLLDPVLSLNVLAEGDVVSTTLLGLPISVSLSKAAESGEQTDVAIVKIGDSTIRLPCNDQGAIEGENIEINLIKGNRTEIQNSSVTGILTGYDVFGGGAGQENDGTDPKGISGGFVGLNHEGLLAYNDMVLCDVVRGTAEMVGPFTGVNDLQSVYDFNTIESIEGNENNYFIYRKYNSALDEVRTAADKLIGAVSDDGDTMYSKFAITHLDTFKVFADLAEAVMVDKDTGEEWMLDAYVSPAKAVLMLDMNTPDNPGGKIAEPGEAADPCDELVTLTIQKIWEDRDGLDNKRPESIKIDIYADLIDDNGQTLSENNFVESVTMFREEHQEAGNTATWRMTKDLPVAQRIVVDSETEIIVYYHYSFAEENIPGYTMTDLEYNEQLYQVTITNTYHAILPLTGGPGDMWYMVIGVAIILLALAIQIRRGRGKKGVR